MSAFVGIVQFDGAPVNPNLLDDLTRSLRAIGPDRQRTTILGRAGMGHALLRTTRKTSREQQPLQLHPGCMLVGDVRLDARQELAAKLGSPRLSGPDDVPDIELVGMAWQRWGENLTEHLAGDFSFAVWDAERNRLFAARDHFGIRTFYYHRTPTRLVFSNALLALLRMPDIGRELNDQAVADFLLFRHNRDPATTSFREIRQVAPAHHVMFRETSCRQQRYWSLPVEEPLRFARDDALLEQFTGLFDTAVNDRIRGGAASVMVSGGLDSTSVAAAAGRQLRLRGEGALHLLTLREPSADAGSDHSLAARLAADLGLELSTVTPGGEVPPALLNSSGWPAPEMQWHKWNTLLAEAFSTMAQKAPIALTGQGGDAVLRRDDGQLAALLRRGRWLAFAREYLAWRQLHGRRPPLGLRSYLRRQFEPQRYPGVPAWIQPDFSADLQLEDRLLQYLRELAPAPDSCHPCRPEAYRQLSSSYWAYILPAHDAQATGQPLEFRHPLFDLRLVRFLLRIASPRWFHRKALLRQAMQERLPDYIGERPKHVWDMSLRRDALLAKDPRYWQHCRTAVEEMSRFVELPVYDRMMQHLRSLPPVEADQLTVPVTLAEWRRSVCSFPTLEGAPGDSQR